MRTHVVQLHYSSTACFSLVAPAHPTWFYIPRSILHNMFVYCCLLPEEDYQGITKMLQIEFCQLPWSVQVLLPNIVYVIHSNMTLKEYITGRSSPQFHQDVLVVALQEWNLQWAWTGNLCLHTWVKMECGLNCYDSIEYPTLYYTILPCENTWILKKMFTYVVTFLGENTLSQMQYYT